MNRIMLDHLFCMLTKQNFENIVLFADDRIHLEKLSHMESIRNNKTIKLYRKEVEPSASQEYKYSEFEGSVQEIALRKRQQKEELMKTFFPPHCIQKICLVGYANHAESGKLIVVFCGLDQMEGGKLGKKTLENIVGFTDHCSEKISNIMFLHAGEITPHAKDFIRVGHPEYKFQLFGVDFLRQNLLEYHLMPKLKVLTPEDKKKLLEKRKLTIDLLPKVWQTDRVMRYLNCSKNSCIYSQRHTFNGHYYNLRVAIEETKEKKVTNKVNKKEK